MVHNAKQSHHKVHKQFPFEQFLEPSHSYFRERDKLCTVDSMHGLVQVRVERYWYSILSAILLLQYCSITILWRSEQVPLKFHIVTSY